MNTTLEAVEFDIDTDEASVRRAAERIRSAVGAADATQPTPATWTGPELRRQRRFPLLTGALLMPVRLTNGRATQINADAPPIEVVTADMSPGGVGIQHERLVPDRICVLSFDLESEQRVALLVKHRWFRQEHGASFRYRSGFEILGVASERQPGPDRLAGRM